MEQTEPKRKSVPGARDVAVQIKALSTTIKSIETEIVECIEKVAAIQEASRANSGSNDLRATLREINEKIKENKRIKKSYFDQLSSFRESIEAIRGSNTKDKGSLNMRDPEEIDKKIDVLNMKLIYETIMPKEEKQIAADLLVLRSMKAKLGDIEDSKNKIRDIDASVKDLKAKIDEIGIEIAQKTAKADEIKKLLDEANAANRIKSPEVVRLEAKIAGLKAQKQDLIKQKNEKKEAIQLLEAERAKFEVLLVEQQKLEEKKSVIKKNIQEIRNKKEALQTEVATFDPKLFDSLHYAVSSLKNAKVFSIDINLVSSLMKHGIKVPHNASAADETLAQLKEKKDGSVAAYKTRNDSVSKEIAALNAKIDEETAKLNELPPTDFDILKKGGRPKKY